MIAAIESQLSPHGVQEHPLVRQAVGLTCCRCSRHPRGLGRAAGRSHRGGWAARL